MKTSLVIESLFSDSPILQLAISSTIWHKCLQSHIIKSNIVTLIFIIKAQDKYQDS